MTWKRGIIWTGNNLEGDQLAFNNEKKAADLTIVLIDCFRISIKQSLYHPLFSTRSIWKQQYWSLSALQNVVTEQPIEPMRGLGDIVVVNSSIFWLARNDGLINIPEMKISLTNYCFCFCWCYRCRRRHRSCWSLLLTAASATTITTIILQSFALLCKLGYCYLKITGITKVKYPWRQFIIFTSSCKWSINLALLRDRSIKSKQNVKMSKWQKTKRFQLII